MELEIMTFVISFPIPVPMPRFTNSPGILAIASKENCHLGYYKTHRFHKKCHVQNVKSKGVPSKMRHHHHVTEKNLG